MADDDCGGAATKRGGNRRRLGTTAAPSGARSWRARATVFMSAGFDGASMNDVARAAGVSKGTLYAYFDSKEQLFEALIREERAQQAERSIVFPADEPDPAKALAIYGRRWSRKSPAPDKLDPCAHRRLCGGEVSAPRPRLLRGGAAVSARCCWRSGSTPMAPPGRWRSPTRSWRRASSSICASATFSSALLFMVVETHPARGDRRHRRRGGRDVHEGLRRAAARADDRPPPPVALPSRRRAI